MSALRPCGPRRRAADASTPPRRFLARPSPAAERRAARRAERIVGAVVWTSLAASIVLVLTA